MDVGGKPYRTIWVDKEDPTIIEVIDQRYLPHTFTTIQLRSFEDFIAAIQSMTVRGAGLIGATAAYALYVAALHAPRQNANHYFSLCADRLIATRPTAVNLKWAVERQMKAISACQSLEDKIARSCAMANEIADEDAAFCWAIGAAGLPLIEEISRKKTDGVVNVLTHCNAGWLAFVDYGSALAPVYAAFDSGIKVHVWVDETRPRNQGANLTAWELLNHGVPHTIISDNTGGHLMQNGLVDLVLTGADRVTRSGDAANKIGTYLKALAAHDNRIPFYVAMPSSTIDWEISDAFAEIIIEERSADEVKYVTGWDGKQQTKVLVAPELSPAANYGFDITPARLITGFITERGICEASATGLQKLFTTSHSNKNENGRLYKI